MRTLEEVTKRFTESKSMFGFDREVLMDYLTYEQLKPHLKAEVKPEEVVAQPITREGVMKALAEYLVFAWGKAGDHRGISASRSVEKLETWVWLLGDDKLLADFKAAGYSNYGCPKLKLLSERLELPMPADAALANMAAGEPCRPDCESGCGR